MALNEKKRKEWEAKNKKKWLYFNEFIKQNKSKDKKGSSLKEEEKSGKHSVFRFVLVIRSSNNLSYSYLSSSPSYKILVMLIMPSVG